MPTWVASWVAGAASTTEMTVMPRELISKKTRIEFREEYVGYVLREITHEFDAADVQCDLDYDPGIAGERRTLVEQYYRTLDFTRWSDVRKLLDVYANHLASLEDNIATQTDEWVKYGPIPVTVGAFLTGPVSIQLTAFAGWSTFDDVDLDCGNFVGEVNGSFETPPNPDGQWSPAFGRPPPDDWKVISRGAGHIHPDTSQFLDFPFP